MKKVHFYLANNAPSVCFTYLSDGDAIKITNLPLYTTKQFVSKLFYYFGPLKYVEQIDAEIASEECISKVFRIILSSQALLSYYEYADAVIFVSRAHNLLSLTSYLYDVYSTPQYPDQLIDKLLENVEDISKPELPISEREVLERLNKEKSFYFYRFYVYQQRKEKVDYLRANESMMKAILCEQKKMGLLYW